ncbi:MAG: DUF465 domain-containing protein [Proteobacteria bacterium]|nr:DUF465 domain-containing protein [Pseudomonadota bacterium]
MEKRDEELIEQLVGENEELATLVKEHAGFEQQLESFNRRHYLTTDEALEKKRLQKLKLAGRDRIETILAEYRKTQE